MISHFNGGNLPDPPTDFPDVDFTGIGWDGTLPDIARAVPFRRAVGVSRLLAQSGANPVIAAACLHRSWLAERVAARSTVPGAPDAFVHDVQEVLRRAE